MKYALESIPTPTPATVTLEVVAVTQAFSVTTNVTTTLCFAWGQEIIPSATIPALLGYNTLGKWVQTVCHSPQGRELWLGYFPIPFDFQTLEPGQ